MLPAISAATLFRLLRPHLVPLLAVYIWTHASTHALHWLGVILSPSPIVRHAIHIHTGKRSNKAIRDALPHLSSPIALFLGNLCAKPFYLEDADIPWLLLPMRTHLATLLPQFGGLFPSISLGKSNDNDRFPRRFVVYFPCRMLKKIPSCFVIISFSPTGNLPFFFIWSVTDFITHHGTWCYYSLPKNQTHVKARNV